MKKDNFIKKIIRKSYDLLCLPIYWIIGLVPRKKNLWVFASWAGKLYNDNSRILFEWVNENHLEIKTVWIAKNKEVINRIRSDGRKAFYTYSLRGIFSMIKAEKVFTSNYTDIPFYFIHGADWYDLWHGMPLKTIHYDCGFDAKFSKWRKRISDFSGKLIPWHSPLNQKVFSTLTNSDFFVPILAHSLHKSEECILRTGSPRCDALFYKRHEKLIDNIRQTYVDCKIILYMPTFRSEGRVKYSKFGVFSWAGKTFNPFVEKYGFDKVEFENVLERNNCVFLYKAHFVDLYSNENNNNFFSRFIPISDSDYDELYNFIGQVDLLVSDYSSIYFDFIATKKPVILCPFDYEDYIKYSRAHYFDYFEHMEGVKAQNWHEFIRILDDKSYYPVSEETRKKFAEYLDGNCCQKVFDAVIARDKEKR